MTTTEAPALTPKQKQVLDLLEKGKSIPEVAKRLKITNAGVYGHMRNMRHAGVSIPGESPAEPDEPAAEESTEGNGNGHANVVHPDLDPEKVVLDAIKACDQQLAAFEQETAEISARVNQLKMDQDAAQAQRERYTKALTALQS